MGYECCFSCSMAREAFEAGLTMEQTLPYSWRDDSRLKCLFSIHLKLAGLEVIIAKKENPFRIFEPCCIPSWRCCIIFENACSSLYTRGPLVACAPSSLILQTRDTSPMTQVKLHPRPPSYQRNREELKLTSHEGNQLRTILTVSNTQCYP